MNASIPAVKLGASALTLSIASVCLVGDGRASSQSALQPHLGVLMPALFPALSAEAAEEKESAVAAAAAVSQAIEDDGVHLFLAETHTGTMDADPLVR